MFVVVRHLRVDVSEVKRVPGKTLQLELSTTWEHPLHWQGEELPFTGPLSVHLTLEGHKGGTILVRGRLASALGVECSRCLEPFDYPLEADFEGAFFPEGKRTDRDEEEFAGQFYAGDTIELDDLLQQSIYLILPMQFLCSPGCQGLCPHCGRRKEEGCHCQSEQVDPRLEVLKQLLQEKS